MDSTTDKKTEILATLADGVARLTSSAQWQAWLDDLSKPRPHSGPPPDAPYSMNGPYSCPKGYVPVFDANGNARCVPSVFDINSGTYVPADPNHPGVYTMRPWGGPLSFTGSGSEINFGGPLDLSVQPGSGTSAVAGPGPIIPTVAPAASQSGSGGLLLAVAAVVLLYLWSQQ